MNQSRLFLITGLVPVVLALAASGCATKHYVMAQLAPVNAKVSALETKTNDQADKEATDVSRVEEKLGSTDSKVAEVASSAQQANAGAAQANQLAQQNQSAIATNQAAVTASIDTLDKAITYSLVATGDVTFAFNKSNLGKTDEMALDSLVQQVQSNSRVVFELVGFTDRVGGTDYNLALSRRRAESVQRYLVRHGIPLRGIHIVGLGKEAVPQGLLADAQAVDANATAANSHRLARRVLIRIYTPNASVPTESASLQR
ncbi:MAG TPA: OmpA family protein [Bryobacteraceae bacterium]|nr:OmpA family protein [Bryobacteraceae bacterium]